MNFRMIIISMLLPALLLAGGPVLAKQHDVYECGTIITEPGKYRLINDLEGCTSGQHGVVIESSDVTLDLRGNTISCDGELYSGGIIIGWWLPETLENVRVRNGTIVNCMDGILLSDAIGARITRMNFMDNWESGILIWPSNERGAQDSLIKNNHFQSNGSAILALRGVGNTFSHNNFQLNDSTILTWDGVGNTYSHNTLMYEFNGMDFQQETDSLIKCNTVMDGGFSISVGSGGSGNEVRGNVVTGSWAGIYLYGVNWTENEVPFMQPVPEGNLVRNNIAVGNGIPGWPASDLNEAMYDLDWDWPYVLDGATCQNTWFNNQFDTSLAPVPCVGESVVLDEEDVCALDDD